MTTETLKDVRAKEFGFCVGNHKQPTGFVSDLRASSRQMEAYLVGCFCALCITLRRDY